MALVLGCRQHVIKQAYKGFIILVTVLECTITCLLSLVPRLVFAGLTNHSGSSQDSFDVRVPKLVGVSAWYLSTVVVASLTTLRSTPVLARPFWSGTHHLVSSRKPFCTTWFE